MKQFNEIPVHQTQAEARRSSQNKLIQLITYRMEEIIWQEHQNQNMIHLYQVDNAWVAFEKSAYLLSQRIKRHNLTSIERVSAPYLVIIVDIPQSELSDLYNLFIIKEDRPEYKVFQTSLSLQLYTDWREENL